jgi:phage-related baseplate assembly protein
MAGAYTQVDLSQLPPPNVVEALDYEAILAEMIADLQARDPVFDALVESDPAYKILEVCAYREVLLRQRINDAAKAVMLAQATGADLDQIGATYGVGRLTVEPGDPAAQPPVPPTLESDAAFRERILLSLEGYTTAGSVGAYHFHALSADGDVKDVGVASPPLVPGQVNVAVLSNTGDGVPSDELLIVVYDALNAETVRPLCDTVVVQAADVVNYAITAVLTIYPGAGREAVLEAATNAATKYAADMHRMGRDITRSGVFAALHQPGVQNVALASPAADIVIGWNQAPWCTGIDVTFGGIDE